MYHYFVKDDISLMLAGEIFTEIPYLRPENGLKNEWEPVVWVTGIVKLCTADC
jgi:hypothetical protein